MGLVLLAEAKQRFAVNADPAECGPTQKGGYGRRVMYWQRGFMDGGTLTPAWRRALRELVACEGVVGDRKGNMFSDEVGV